MSRSSKQTIFQGALFTLTGIFTIILMIAYHTDYTLFLTILFCVIGLIMAGIGVLMLIVGFPKKSNEMEFTESEFEINPASGLGKSHPILQSFRNQLSDFLKMPGIQENSPIQDDTTQLFKHMLYLQKRRLDKLQVSLEFQSIRRNYSGTPVIERQFFDGSNKITECQEEIEAKRRYSKNGNKILMKTDAEVAHYTMIATSAEGDETVICPSCGARSTRANLMDGCDYCGTKFTDLELGSKISGFALRKNYKVAYAKYREKRKIYAYWANMAFFALSYFFVGAILCILFFDDEVSGATYEVSSSFFDAFGLVLGMVVVTSLMAVIIAIGLSTLYSVTIFPVMEISARVKYHEGKHYDELKKAANASAAAEKAAHHFDSNFSAAGFYSNIQNKLSVLFFAENDKQINAFSEQDLSGLLPRFREVIDYDLDEIRMTSYQVKEGLQEAKVMADLTLYESNGKAKKCSINMTLVKDAACKTQTVFAPHVLRCPNCGNSLTLENGLLCNYCGQKPDLKQYDWTIVELSI
ncbi:MAG: hypothetical protein KBS83_09095 [Lachnospiraceae bacterium]|nr:hypothetical protein [Candidatus Equihabitans merdae]